MVNEKYKNNLLEIVLKYIPDCKIYLFGSRANGTFACGSDIDIALDCGFPIPDKILSEIKEDIEESHIPYFVDVIDFCNIDEVFKNEILKNRIVWKS